jgi:Fe-S cluster biogenesis protein NfuA/nitrite reductase/ring-hydroxylating ferredoxin subunit
MASTGRPDPEAPDDDTRWRTAGDRIQTLLDASAASGTIVRERTERLAAELTDLYGAALERIVSITARSDPDLLSRFASDDLIASLMLVHGVHPHSVHRRIEDALERVRPYLGSHGGDVSLLEVVDDPSAPESVVARLRFAGSCKSCPSSAVTLELGVEDAVRAAAPEVTTIEVAVPEEDPDASTGLIAADSLMSRIHTRHDVPTAWHPVPDLADLGPGEVGGFLVAGTAIRVCRVGDDLFAYHDRCGRCGDSMAGAVLHRALSGPARAVLRCPRCGAHFDVVHAGAGIDGASDARTHLDPIPLLLRDGVPSVAVLAETTGVM